MTKSQQREMFTVCIQTVLLLQPVTTQGRSLFRHSPTALSMMRWPSWCHSSTMRYRRSWTSLILVLCTRSSNVPDIL